MVIISFWYSILLVLFQQTGRNDKKEGFKPEVIIDKHGKQQHKFKAGQHVIAVKVVDNDGLDNIELITLKVNGAVERT